MGKDNRKLLNVLKLKSLQEDGGHIGITAAMGVDGIKFDKPKIRKSIKGQRTKKRLKSSSISNEDKKIKTCKKNKKGKTAICVIQERRKQLRYRKYQLNCLKSATCSSNNTLTTGTAEFSDADISRSIIETIDEPSNPIPSEMPGMVIPSYCKIIAINNFEASLICMKQICEGVKLHGCFNIKCIKGSCSINGHTLFSNGKLFTVNCPNTHAVFKLIPCASNLKDCTEKYVFKENTINESIARKFDILVVVERVESPHRPLPGYTDIYEEKDIDANEKYKLCDGGWASNTPWCFEVYPSFQKVTNDMLHASAAPCVVTAGGKNVGKSSFNRYLINRLLTKYPSVYFLECDVGQTEFTPSGMISLHKIDGDNPLLGPPFTHQRKPLFSCFFGKFSPAGDPDRYSNIVRCVVDKFTQSGDEERPLVVNTMGWTRGLGFHLIVDTIRYLRPTHVVQFDTSRDSRNYNAPLTCERLAAAVGWLTSSTCELRHAHVPIRVDVAPPATVKYVASDMRNLALLACLSTSDRDDGRPDFHGEHNADNTGDDDYLTGLLSGGRVYVASLSTMRVFNATDEPVPTRLTLAALNAAIVGLCCVRCEDNTESSNEDEQNLPPPPILCRCVGLGVVRGVDPDSRTFHVVTKLSADEMREVNCVVIGQLALPENLLLQQAKSVASLSERGGIPYVTRNFPYETVGAERFRVYRKFIKINR